LLCASVQNVTEVFNKDFIAKIRIIKQRSAENLIKMEIHKLDEDQFCSGASFVPTVGGPYEDDGWIISFVHNERTNTSQASFLSNIV
jgi:carotenoid cleavage dioxygenase-like enzyme